jgi:hypothetical protein
LIIRAYDAMGHCDAAQRQRDFFQDAHPDQRAPRPNQCADAVRVRLDCQPVGTPVRIDRVISASCGQTIALPVGEHLFATVNQRQYVRHALTAGQSRLSLDVDRERAGQRVAQERPDEPAAARRSAGASAPSAGGRTSDRHVALIEEEEQADKTRLICSGSSYGPSKNCIAVGEGEVADVSEFASPLLYIEDPEEAEQYVPTVCYEQESRLFSSAPDERDCVRVESGDETRTCCSVDRVE